MLRSCPAGHRCIGLQKPIAMNGVRRMKSVRLGAVLLMVYGVVVLLNAALYTYWSGDPGGFPHAAIRAGGVILVAVGLWKAHCWAWWVAVVLGSALFVVGALGFGIIVSSGVLESRPYPIADYAVFIISIGALLGAELALLLPGSRAAIRRAT